MADDPNNPNPPQDTPWFQGFIKEDGTINRDSFSKMPEQFRPLADGELKNITNAEQLMQKVHGLSTLAGRKALAPLPEGASAEDIAAQQAVIRAINGVPEKPDGYAFARPEDFPEEAWDNDNAQAAAQLLHKYNAPPALAKDLLALQIGSVQKQMQAQQQYEQEFYEQQDQAFREGLKKTGDDYDKVMNLVQLTGRKFGMDDESPLYKNAAVRNMLFEVAKTIGEDKFIGGGPGDNGTKSAQALAESIMHDKTNPDYEAYWTPGHPKNKEVKARVYGYMEQAAKQAQAQAQRK